MGEFRLGHTKIEVIITTGRKFTFSEEDALFWKSWRHFKFANVPHALRTGVRCWYCGVPTVPQIGGNKSYSLTRDHVNPRSRGGKNGSNLVPACMYCNTLKGNAKLEEFRYFLSGRFGVPVEDVVFYGESI